MESIRGRMGEVVKPSDKPSFADGLSAFWNRTVFSVRLIFEEKELLTFALLQWVCIGIGYYLWVQMLGWLPDEMWERAANSSHGGRLGDYIMLAWSFLCVGVATFPMSILSGCMGAVYFLKAQGKESTIPACLKIVLPATRDLWLFHWVDGWWTVVRILARLPKKRGESPVERAVNEAVYYAWKVATIGILPGLVTGRGLMDAGRRSLGMVKSRLRDVLLLRGGYSALCWIVGIASYIFSIWFFIAFPEFRYQGQQFMYRFYFWMAVPVLCASGVVLVFLRPVYIISACAIYTDYVQTERKESIMVPARPGQKRGSFDFAFTMAVIIAVVLLAVVFTPGHFGIGELVAGSWTR